MMRQLALTAQTLFGIRLTERQTLALARYEQELLEWNRKYNLTAIRDSEGIRVRHFLDSFSCVQAWQDSPPRSLIDVGTGAGFPGIPLKILYPSMRVTLVESVGKKARFCRHIIETLELEGIEVIQRRAETLGQLPEHRETYDWAIARAVARLRVLSEYLLPLIRIGGTMLAQKGERGPAEIPPAENAMTLLGGHFRRMIPITLPGVAEERYLILVDKIAATPPKYPRKPGIPAKRPL
jgi:16S rRNA (guanine527-N7)-methyltransferase